MQELIKLIIRGASVMLKMGVIYMIIFILETQKFITENYTVIYCLIMGAAMIGLLFLETKTKKIIKGEYTAEDCRKLQVRGNRFRDICITLAVLVSLIAERYAGAVILLVVEIMMLRVGNSRLEREIELQKGMMEAKEKMFILEIKHIVKTLRGEL